MARGGGGKTNFGKSDPRVDVMGTRPDMDEVSVKSSTGGIKHCQRSAGRFGLLCSYHQSSMAQIKSREEGSEPRVALGPSF